MKLLDCLRAKSITEDENPLLRDHIKEGLERVTELYQFVNEHNDFINFEILSNENDIEAFFENLAKAVIIHDLGKIEYQFQWKLFSKEEKDSEEWATIKSFFKPLKKRDIHYPRHEILSALWSSFLTGNSEWDGIIRSSIILHHYNRYFIDHKDLMAIIQDYYDSVIAYLEFLQGNIEAINDFIDSLLEYIEAEFSNYPFFNSALNKLRESKDFEKIEILLEKIKLREDDISEFAKFYNHADKSSDYEFLVFLGCLRRCDYSSSGDVRVEKSSNLVDVYGDLNEWIKKSKNIDYLWQEEFLTDNGNTQSLVFVAPTGSGKTEFALLWAKNNGRKLLYTLPLRVALNDLYFRFATADDAYFGEDAVDILHSTSFIEYLKEERENRELDIDKQLTSAKLLSSPILLTTPDQVFLTSLNYYGSDKVMAVYPLSSVVIDEIQTYNEEMAAIVVKTLQMIDELGGKVLVITATLPPYYKTFFEELGYEIFDLRNYDVKDKIKNYNVKRHKLSVIGESLFGYDNGEVLLTNEAEKELESNMSYLKNNNTIFVVNNVKKAIKLYDWIIGQTSIDKEFRDNNIFLLHSRIIEKEKYRRIEDIKKKMEKENVIVVATQIVEASVDLDFDVMVTEISTIDSQVQRWGRVYRNRSSNYSGEDPNIIIFTGKRQDDGLKIDKGTSAVYDKKVIEITEKVLKDNQSSDILNYENERKMVEEVFETKIGEKTLNDLYSEKIKSIVEELDYFTVEKKSQAQKLFRNIAGVSVVIPQLMNENEVLKEFSKIIQKPEMSNKNWRDIEESINEKTDNKVGKWYLKKILYEHSVSIPTFSLEKNYFWKNRTHEFKGFYVLKMPENLLKDVERYGVDRVLEQLEKDEIENNIA
ncbi:MAG: CRISPR-associated helicase Cas3' [Petrotogales bacterium]